MRPYTFAPLQAVTMFVLGVVVGSGVLSGFAPGSQTALDPVITTSINAACKSGDAVSDFVCRNRWMGQHQYSYR